MDAEVDALYALAPGDFTAARDALAKRLRSDGRRDEAAAVKALRRPSVAAAALNRVARRHPDAVQELLAAGSQLADAQERLVSGGGDRAALRDATDRVRAAVSAVAALAAQVETLSQAVQDRVRATLQAALVDEGVRDALAAGRLEREAEASGTMLLTGAPPPHRERPAPAPGRPAEPSRRRSEAAALRAERDAAGERLREANRVVRELEREVDRACQRVDRTTATVDDLRERLTFAEREAGEASAEADALRARLRDAKAQAAAAQQARDELDEI